uniref:Transcription regulator Rua1 C-terminal domain-containing protein n=1 Tax=Bionectria ochroleuca TaxID=29856 RepID=A0A8H7K6D3_BIOOC
MDTQRENEEYSSQNTSQTASSDGATMAPTRATQYGYFGMEAIQYPSMQTLSYQPEYCSTSFLPNMPHGFVNLFNPMDPNWLSNQMDGYTPTWAGPSWPDVQNDYGPMPIEEPMRRNPTLPAPWSDNPEHRIAPPTSEATSDNISDLCIPSFEEQHKPPAEDFNSMPIPLLQQVNPRDLYSPVWVRGEGKAREGWCGWCQTWLNLKNSAYWYDKIFKHGIMLKGFLPRPQQIRQVDEHSKGFCRACGKWITLGTSDGNRPSWFRHIYKCTNV